MGIDRKPDGRGGHPDDLGALGQNLLEKAHQTMDVVLEVLDPIRPPTIDVPKALETKAKDNWGQFKMKWQLRAAFDSTSEILNGEGLLAQILLGQGG